MSLDAEISKGARFAELKEPFGEIIQAMRDALDKQIDTVPMTQVDMHSKLILSRQLLNNIERHIQTVIDTGKMAQFQVNQQAERKSWWERMAA